MIIMQKYIIFVHVHFHMTSNLRAYSFGLMKSAKSSANGRLRREKCQLPKDWEF